MDFGESAIYYLILQQRYLSVCSLEMCVCLCFLY